MGKTEMTSYERIMTALEGGKPDRVPALLFMRDWATKSAGFTFSEVLENPNKYVYAQYRALRDIGADVIWDLMGFHSESEAMGSVLKIPKDGPPSVAEFPVKSLSQDVEKLRLPNPHGQKSSRAFPHELPLIGLRLPARQIGNWPRKICRLQ